MIILYGMMAVLAGAMVTVSSALNAQVGRRHGIYTAALINNSLATVITGAILLFLYNGLGIQANVFLEIPTWALFGGVAAIIIVVGSNVIIPQMPIIYTSLLVFIGQFSMGLVMDILNGRSLSGGKLFGFLLVLGGLLYNFYIDKTGNR